jgi:cyanophycinase
MKGINSKVEVITTASEIPEEVGNNYVEAFKRLGCDGVDVIHIKNREDALKPEYYKRIQEADGVMFTGGNQMRLTTIFGGTDILKLLHERYENEHFVIAGTSALTLARNQ